VAAVTPTIATDVDANRQQVDFDTYRQTQIASLKGQFVLQAALKKPGIATLASVQAAPDPVAWLEEKIDVSFPHDGEIMRVTLPLDDPDDAVALVGAVVDAYLEEVVDKERLTRTVMFDQLQRAYQQTREEIRKELEKYRTLANRLGGSESETAGVNRQMALSRLDLLQKRRWEIDKSLDETQLALQLNEVHQRRLAAPPEDGPVEEVEHNEPSDAAGSDEDSARDKMDEEGEARQDAVPAQGDDRNRQPLELQTELLELRRVHYARKLDELDKEIDKIHQELGDLSAKNVELEERRATLTGLNEMAAAMQGKLDAWEIELSAPPRVTQLQGAVYGPIER